MKKTKYVWVAFLCLVFFAGCSKKTDVKTSTLFVEKKGNLISVDVEALDKDYYDESELESYISDHVEEYNSKNGGNVKKSSFNVKDGIAKLMMEYESYEDYAGFNGIEFYSGTVLKAQADGYDFDTEFYSPAEDMGSSKAAAKEDVLADEDYKAIIIKAHVDVQVPGELLYVSSKNVEIKGDNTVSILNSNSDGDEAELTYIIYK